MTNAPIVVFAYRRPEKLRNCLKHLAMCPEAAESHLVIYVDGPKHESELHDVLKTRTVAQEAIGFREVTVQSSPQNLGLAASIIAGVTAMFESNEKIIVLEDDLEVAPGFLTFMNQALITYESTPEVISIHGYCYPTKDSLPKTFFLRGADCWGWATWKRGWDLFCPDGETLMEELKQSGELDLFDFNGFGGFLEMLDDHISGRVDSWAIRWYATAFLKRKLTLYPGRSLVRNNGVDGSGTHGGKSKFFDVNLPTSAPTVSWEQPVESSEAREAFGNFFRNQRLKRGLKIISRLRALSFRVGINRGKVDENERVTQKHRSKGLLDRHNALPGSRNVMGPG